MIGKKLDTTWKAYAANSVKDYLDRNHISNYETRVQIIDACIKEYLKFIREQEVRLTHIDIAAMKAHNDNEAGIVDNVVWWNPTTWHLRSCLNSENANGSSLALPSYSNSQLILMAFGGAILMGGAIYFTSKVSSALTKCFTTHNPALPPTLLSTIDTSLNNLTSTTQKLSQQLTVISENFVSTHDLGLARNTSTPLTEVIAKRFTDKLSNGLSRVGESILEYSRSLK